MHGWMNFFFIAFRYTRTAMHEWMDECDIARDILMVDGEDMVWLQLLLLLKTCYQRHDFARTTLQSFFIH
jgi:hypothetical protein